MDSLFDPEHVREMLVGLPSLGSALAPDRESVSEWFPTIRKSSRQIYRVLGNTHYGHLVELLRALDFCLERGFSQPSILRTRSRERFGSDIAELRVAEHFAVLGAGIAGFDADKGEEAVPDVAATMASGLVLAAEVFCPVQWEHAERLTQSLQDVVKNSDLPWDYKFRMAFDQLHVMDKQGRLLVSHPGELEHHLGDGRGTQLAREIEDAFGEMLNDPSEPHRIAHEDATSNLRVTVELDDLAYTTAHLPARGGSISLPSKSGYSLAGLFTRLLKKGANKAARGQALKVPADHAVLVVDVGGSDIASELAHPEYRRAFSEMHAASAAEARGGYSAMIYVDTAGWGRPFVPLFTSYADGVPSEVIAILEARSAR